MIARVCWWNAARGVGGAEMLWPTKGLGLALRPTSFMGGRVPPLSQGCFVVFAALTADGVAVRAVRWEPPRPIRFLDGDLGLTGPPEPDPEDDAEAPSRLVPLTFSSVTIPPPKRFWPTVWMCPRACIVCQRTFLSEGPTHRVCHRCLPPANGNGDGP